MPAAAVIPAPVAYIKVVAVKKLVVGFLADRVWSGVLRALCTVLRLPSFRRAVPTASCGRARATRIVYFEKIRVFQASIRFEYISME